ncbi:hypothetical protein MQA17_25600 [Escherichia coli]|nr:hypothetical protein [Escherichia coli]
MFSEHSSAMLRFAVVLVVISCAYAQLHSICHSNAQQLSEAEVISQWVVALDRNADGIITTGEVVLGFRDILGQDLSVSDEAILGMSREELVALGHSLSYSYTKHEFVQAWHAHFHDNIDFIGAVFDAFDTNHDGIVDMLEIEGILSLVLTYDDDGDDLIQEDELIRFFEHIYTCAP